MEDIYTRFNINHPEDFRGHSLSVSDVVVLHQNGKDTAHYVDSFGFKEVPGFSKAVSQDTSLRAQLDNAKRQAAETETVSYTHLDVYKRQEHQTQTKKKYG